MKDWNQETVEQDMTPTGLPESTIEEVACDWLAGLGWPVAYRSDFSPDGLRLERP